MIHATRELVDAMAGACPSSRSPGASGELRVACDSPKWNVHSTTMACIGWASSRDVMEHVLEVACPKCLAIMDAARGQRRREELVVYGDLIMERTG